ncbi:Uncharacterised protein [Bordetella pertussis]|nr:Uncharacterised protein [Bordetella pertussis]
MSTPWRWCRARMAAAVAGHATRSRTRDARSTTCTDNPACAATAAVSSPI